MQLVCLSCNSTLVKKNGHISNGKQNYQCLLCERQFVENSTQQLIDDKTRDLVRKALLERVSLLGICRIFDVSMPWLLDLLQSIFEALPEDLCAKVDSCDESDVEIVELEADEVWSFVGSKENRQWLWLAIHRPSRQIIAMHVGPRNEASAKSFYEKLPVELKKKRVIYTDQLLAYACAIPESEHVSAPKGSGETNYIERFNCTIRQRCSRLVRKALSFSKKLTNHIGHIKYFICNYNQEIQRKSAASINC